MQLSNTFRYFYFQPKGGVISLGSQLRLIVVSGIGIPYTLYHKLLCLPLICTYPTLSGISTCNQEGVKTVWGLSSDWQIYLDLAFLIYSTRSYCAYFWCAPFQHIQVFLLFVRRWSQLFGGSVQTDNGISISHSLYTLPEDIVPTSGVKLSNTFRYFYSWPGGVSTLWNVSSD